MLYSQMPVLLVLFILVAHFISDFVLQDDKVALSKSSSLYWLTHHVVIYVGGMFMCMMVTMLLLSDLWITVDVLLFWCLINGVLHWVTDFFTSRINAWLWKQEQRHWFFVMIGVDQLIHYACLLITAAWLQTHGVRFW